MKWKLGWVCMLVAMASACTSSDGAESDGGGNTAGTTGSNNNPMTGNTGGMMSNTGGTMSNTGGMMSNTGGTMSNTGGMTSNPMTGQAGEGGSSGTGGGNTGGPVECATQDVVEGQCKDMAEGIYAIKSEIDVWWGNQEGDLAAIVDPGRGKIVIHLLAELSDVCDDGSAGRGVIRACGASLPAFKSDVSCDVYQIEFPETIWDSPDIPTFTTDGSTTGFDPGDILTLQKATGLVGISLADDGTWPTPEETGTFNCQLGAGEECFPDHDGDGNPGITVTIRTSGEYSADGCGGFDSAFTYRGAPTIVDPLAGGGLGGGRRAAEVYIGLRTVLGGAGAINGTCDGGTGESEADGLDSRAFGCTIAAGTEQGGGTDCTIEEAQFVDSNVPIYNILNKEDVPPSDLQLPQPQQDRGDDIDRTPSPGPLSALVRLGGLDEEFSCADVRGANFPAFE